MLLCSYPCIEIFAHLESFEYEKKKKRPRREIKQWLQIHGGCWLVGVTVALSLVVVTITMCNEERREIESNWEGKWTGGRDEKSEKFEVRNWEKMY